MEHEYQDWGQATLCTELSHQLQKYQLTVSSRWWGPASLGLGMWTVPIGRSGSLWSPGCENMSSRKGLRTAPLWALRWSCECSYRTGQRDLVPHPLVSRFPIPSHQSMRKSSSRWKQKVLFTHRLGLRALSKGGWQGIWMGAHLVPHLYLETGEL